MARPRSLVLFVLVLLLGGCGRVAFDLSSDARTDTSEDAFVCIAPTGHDEDADGLDDACDSCPEVAGVQPDTGGDGIGDACDWEPTRQVRTLFDPFVAMRPEWSYLGPITFSGDAMQLDATGANYGAILVAPPSGREVFEAGGDVRTGGAGMRQLAIHLTQGAGAYYCELYDDGSGFGLHLTQTLDNMTYTTVDKASLPGRLASSTFQIVLVHEPPMVRCIGTWGAQVVMVSGTPPGGVTPNRADIAAINVDVDVAYFARFSTP